MEERVDLLETKLKEANDRLKRDRRAANEALNEHINIQRTLKHKLASSNERNGLLSQLLEQYQQSSEVSTMCVCVCVCVCSWSFREIILYFI
jgi:hypothetical protein